jgi:hypothetical protein
MAGEVVQAKTLQERVGDRIREQIGDLLTDDDLKKLVDRALEDAFFKERRENRQYGQDILHPPQIVQRVNDLLKERVDTAVSAWLSKPENSERFQRQIDDAIAKGFIGILTGWINDKAQVGLQQFANEFASRLGIRNY